MSSVARAILWILMIIAPGGVFLLPLLMGDAIARRRRTERDPMRSVTPSGTSSVDPAVAVASSRP